MKLESIILLLTFIQFVNILDFVMVMPMAPDFVSDLNISISQIGLIGSAYSLAAGITGACMSLIIDRFDRKKAMRFFLFGLGLSTISSAFALNIDWMLISRLIAGICGGSLSSLIIAMIADVVPVAKRGQSMGKVMSAFSIAMVIGVPFGLEVSRLTHWRVTFLIVGAAAMIAFFQSKKLPEDTNQLRFDNTKIAFCKMIAFFRRKEAIAVLGAIFIGMVSIFMLIPYISAHMQYALNVPRENIWILYLNGGAATFFSMRYLGKLIDKYGANIASGISISLYIPAILFIFIMPLHFIHPALLFICMMVGGSTRNLVGQTVSSKIASPKERGTYATIQSSISNLGSAIGSYLSSLIVLADLSNIALVGLISIALVLLFPYLIYVADKAIQKNETQLS